MDDVTLEDVTAQTAAFALEGPNADGVARAALGGAPDAGPHGHCSIGETSLYRSTLSGSAGLWISTPPERSADIRQRLLAAGASEVAPEDLEIVRVENRIPELDSDYFDTNIPHETQQLQIVSFTKGCYTGQEIVERVRSQGRVNRVLAPVEIEAPSPTGDVGVNFQGKGVGKATSLVSSPRTGKLAGFAILRREAAEPGTDITVGGAPGRVLSWTE